MEEGTKDKPLGKVLIFMQDANRVVCRQGTKTGEDDGFLFIINEEQKPEAIAKRLIVRYVGVL